MSLNDFANKVLILCMAGMISACGSDQANRSASRGPALTPKADNVSSQQLSAGIEAMKPRVLHTVDAFSKVEPTPEFRYFMHPTIDKDAVIEFDVSGLSSVTLSPRISPLDRNCMKDPAAGEVEISYVLDDAEPTRLTIDRNFDQLLIVRVGDSDKLTVSVNQGNGVVTCDWFGLGLSDVLDESRSTAAGS